ncbi:hypothetical protein MMRN_19220 [Mycobacterium marinum]|nr:hypothetical protein MMRN_19220 [Mycobacterium marinum]
MTTTPPGLDPAVTERIGELLRARGLRRMASRIQVLAVLEPVNGHLSVAEIHQRLAARLPAGAQPPDLATIYRTVTTLVQQGVLHALTLDGASPPTDWPPPPTTTRYAPNARRSSKYPHDS